MLTFVLLYIAVARSAAEHERVAICADNERVCAHSTLLYINNWGVNLVHSELKQIWQCFPGDMT